MTLDLDAILKLADEAEQEHARTTPGPYIRDITDEDILTVSGSRGLLCCIEGSAEYEQDVADADWIAHEHERHWWEPMRELITEVERLQGELRKSQGLFDESHEAWEGEFAESKRLADDRDTIEDRAEALERVLARLAGWLDVIRTNKLMTTTDNKAFADVESVLKRLRELEGV